MVGWVLLVVPVVRRDQLWGSLEGSMNFLEGFWSLIVAYLRILEQNVHLDSADALRSCSLRSWEPWSVELWSMVFEQNAQVEAVFVVAPGISMFLIRSSDFVICAMLLCDAASDDFVNSAFSVPKGVPTRDCCVDDETDEKYPESVLICQDGGNDG